MPMFPVHAQRSHLEQGDDYFRKRYYVEAIQEYQLALNEKVVVKRFYMTERVAKTYRMLFDYENAVTWYGKLMEFKEENSAENMLHYALLLMNLERYEEAKKVFEQYVAKAALPKNEYKEWCDWAMLHKDSVRKFSVYKTDIETGSRSMGIAFYKEGLVFANPQIQDFATKTAFYDLAYVKCFDSVKFDKPLMLTGDLNRSFYEGTPNFSSDQQTLYYSGNATTVTKYRPRKAEKLKISEEGINILKIYSVNLQNGNWTNVKELSFNGSEFDCVFPFLTADGKSIYFASNMKSSLGGYDIYRSDANPDGSWSLPVNLGPKVNSALDEMYPFVKGDSLFFSSKGKAGFGGADIYVAKLKGRVVEEVSNLGKPFNSSKDDFSFIVREDKGLLHGYFSSNREGTHGYDRIYYFRQHPKPVYPDTISGIALNKITLQPLRDVKITLVKKPSGKPVEKVKEKITDVTGKVELILDKNVEYTVSFEAPGFQTKTIDVPASDRKDVLAAFGELQMEPAIAKNTVIKIPNIYFDYDKATLRPESFKVLAQIIDFLNDNPSIRVEMSAHTDARGSDPYNLKLSQKRAESTVKYLIEHGIDAKRLVPKGYGETKILNQCKNGVKCSEEDHEFNRRVEMKVL
jgi:outer membrane protein OmpA-like peptidoglycan-associated protein/tetratricopeptide (TPR) repeat protein